jgi:hypothetical protein
MGERVRKSGTCTGAFFSDLQRELLVVDIDELWVSERGARGGNGGGSGCPDDSKPQLTLLIPMAEITRRLTGN